MTIPNSESARFALPIRIRSKPGPDTGGAAQARLAGRIAGLPGVQTTQDSAAQPPCIVGTYLRPSPLNLRRRPPSAVRFCRISTDGVMVEGLSDFERYQALARGWGRLDSRSILLFLPRDDDEFEVCCYILRQAYKSISIPPATRRSAARLPLPELPEFSRTTLC
jgi:hypothetical protein